MVARLSRLVDRNGVIASWGMLCLSPDIRSGKASHPSTHQRARIGRDHRHGNLVAPWRCPPPSRLRHPNAWHQRIPINALSLSDDLHDFCSVLRRCVRANPAIAGTMGASLPSPPGGEHEDADAGPRLAVRGDVRDRAGSSAVGSRVLRGDHLQEELHRAVPPLLHALIAAAGARRSPAGEPLPRRAIYFRPAPEPRPASSSPAISATFRDAPAPPSRPRISASPATI